MSARSAEDALLLLERLGAPDRLLRHHILVLEAADELLASLAPDCLGIDAELVRMGAAVHDAGKIVHPHELTGSGRRHEEDGGPLLEQAGASHLARFCESHSRWRGRQLPLEDLLVALSDVLWKGHRSRELEERVMELM